ncbi:MAG: hypothetical protein AVDCRST_MAG96-2008, partial [uncultured Segetibacter sp.]
MADKIKLIWRRLEAGAKILSSEACNMFILKMENAAIILRNAQFVKFFVFNMMMQDDVDEEHKKMIRNE